MKIFAKVLTNVGIIAFLNFPIGRILNYGQRNRTYLSLWIYLGKQKHLSPLQPQGIQDMMTFGIYDREENRAYNKALNTIMR